MSAEGAGEGAASGAMGGASFGPWGAAIGAGVGIVGSMMKGQSEQDALDTQAGLQRKNAIVALQAAKFNADRESRMATTTMGRMSAGYAASGVSQDSGSVLAVLGASAANAELDKQEILYGGQIRKTAYENQASLDERAGGNAMTGAYFSSLAQVINAGTKISSYNYGGGNPGPKYETDFSMDNLGSGQSVGLDATNKNIDPFGVA